MSFINPSFTMPDYGLYSGLAVKVPFEQYAAEDRQAANDLENAKARAASRAKLLSDDFDYNNSINAYDHAIIKDYATKALTDIGKWQTQNPGWQYNPQLYTQRKTMLKELKDNDFLHKGMRVDAEIKRYQDYVNDPKNADVRDLPEVQQYKQHLNNYLTTGSVDGVKGNNAEFKFAPPDEAVDLTNVYKTYGEATNHSLQKPKFIAPGVGVNWSAATTADKLSSAQALLNNGAPSVKKWINKYYKDYLEKNKDTPNPLSLENFVVQQIEPFIKDDDYKTFNYDTKVGGVGGSGKTPKATDNLLKETVTEAVKRNGNPVSADPDGLHQLFVGKNGSLNLQNSSIITKNGDVIPFNGGLTKDYSFSGATMKKYGNSLVATFKARVPIAEFEKALGGADVFDMPNWYSPSSWGSDVRDKFKDYPIVVTKGEDGKEYAEVEITKPIDYNNQSTHYAYNYGAHGKPEEFSSETQNQKQVSYTVLVQRYGKEGADEFVGKYGSQIQIVK